MSNEHFFENLSEINRTVQAIVEHADALSKAEDTDLNPDAELRERTAKLSLVAMNFLSKILARLTDLDRVEATDEPDDLKSKHIAALENLWDEAQQESEKPKTAARGYYLSGILSGITQSIHRIKNLNPRNQN